MRNQRFIAELYSKRHQARHPFIKVFVVEAKHAFHSSLNRFRCEKHFGGKGKRRKHVLTNSCTLVQSRQATQVSVYTHNSWSKYPRASDAGCR